MKFLLSIFTISVLLISCKKDFDNSNAINQIKLPDFTESGKTIFGFKMNDSVWTNFGKHYTNIGVASGWEENKIISSYFITGPSEMSFQVGGRLTVVQNSRAIKDISAGFSFVPTKPYVMTYFLSGLYPRNFNVNDVVNNKYYRTSNTRPFNLQVTKFDTSNKICSGRFSGTLYNDQNQNDSIKITDGRFDVKFPY